MGRKGEIMRLIFAVGFLCMASAFAFGQTGASISGTVKGNLLPDSTVTVTLSALPDNSKLSINQTAGKDGRFRFENVPDGKYLLKAAINISEGALEDDATIAIVNGVSKDVVLELRLRGFPIRESVNISAGLSQTIEQVSKTVEV